MTTPAIPQLGELMQIAVPVKEIEPAVTFYRDTLGLPFLFQAGTLAFFNAGGVRLMVSVPESEGFDRGSVLYFRVADLDSAYEAFRGRGVDFVGEPHLVHSDGTNDLRMAFFNDGQGNVHALASETPVKR